LQKASIISIERYLPRVSPQFVSLFNFLFTKWSAWND